MRGVAQAANYVRAKRAQVSADNPFVASQQQFSKAMVDALNLYRDIRDEQVERSFHAFYGSPLVQARRPRGRIAQGDMLDAVARITVYIYRAQHRVDERTFNALRKLLLAYPEVSPAAFKAALREQWAILTLDERAAIAALPQLLPQNAARRRTCSELLKSTVAATGKLNADGQRRMNEILHLLADGMGQDGTREIAAE